MAKYVSHKKDFYDYQFPRGRLSRRQDEQRFQRDYADLRSTFSEQFNLDHLNKIFQSVIFCNGEDVIPIFDAIIDKTGHTEVQTLYHTVDSLVYKCTVEVTVPNTPGVYKCIAIRMSNDGFLYPQETELRGHWERREVHRIKDWFYLDDSEKAKLNELINFGNRRLLPNYTTLARYNSHEERIDIHLRDSEMRVIKFCYEYGTPTEDFDDKWTHEWTPESWLAVRNTYNNIVSFFIANYFH